jgi:hypothetical protein
MIFLIGSTFSPSLLEYIHKDTLSSPLEKAAKIIPLDSFLVYPYICTMNSEQLAIIASKTIQGVPGCKIAQDLGVHESSVCRAKQRPDVRAKVEAAGNDIIDRGLKPAIRTICRLAAEGNKKSAPIDMLKLSLDASKHITAIAGLSGNAPGTIINQLININLADESSPQIQALQSAIEAQWETTNNQTVCITPSLTPVA